MRDLVRIMTSNSSNYDEKYMKTKFNSDDDLSLMKMLELYIMIIGIRSAFLKS